MAKTVISNENFFARPVRATLQAGEYACVLNAYKHVFTPEDEEPKDYMQLEVAYPDGRVYRHTFFPSSYNYLISCIRTQHDLKAEEFESAYDLLDSVCEKPLTVWISYSEYGMNVALHAKKDSVSKGKARNLEDVEDED